jgi:hypothetical protein
MAFTRFHDDPARIQKQLQENTYIGRYQLNTPGQGKQLPFQEDPNMRLQFWGANLSTNTVQLESELRGMTRPLNRDLLEINDYKKNPTPISFISSFGVAEPFIEESRASHPAWQYRNMNIDRWEFPWLNPQANIEKPFNENIQTRILEKDFFHPTIPVVSGNPDYYLTGNTLCLGNEKSLNN